MSLLLAGAAAAVAPGPVRAADWGWGRAEADLDKAMPGVHAYVVRMSDLRDSGARPDPCGKSLGLTDGRRSLERMAAAARQQLARPAARDEAREARLTALIRLEESLRKDDRNMVRIMTELRGTFTADQLARKLGKPLPPDIAAIFAAPMRQEEVIAQLQSIQARVSMLAAAHASERARIASASFPDSGPGRPSALRQQALAQLDARMDAARTTLCAPVLAYFHRCLVTYIDPLVPKWRAQVRPGIAAETER